MLQDLLDRKVLLNHPLLLPLYPHRIHNLLMFNPHNLKLAKKPVAILELLQLGLALELLFIVLINYFRPLII